MAQFYHHYNTHQQHPTPASAAASHSHHGRNRRQPRLSVSQNQSHKQFRGVRSMKELSPASTSVTKFRQSYEMGRSFDLEDDFDFVPTLITESDLVYSSGSERSSLASNSPTGSPTQQPQQVAASYTLNSNSPAFLPASFQSQHSSLKLHQPAATRARNAIPIINPANGQGLTMPSPPSSVSPSVRMQQQVLRHRW